MTATPHPTSPAHQSALIYTRVSTRGQEEDGSSLDSQEQACRDYAAAHGYSVAQVTREVYSGAELWDRPLLSRDREDIAAGRYAALICYATDRLARNPVHVLLIAEECDHVNVALHFVSEPLDSTPEGQLITHVRGFAAQLEREKIRERSLRGKRYRAASGKLHNSGTDLYGYRRDREAGVRLIYEPEALIVRRIFEWMAVEQIGSVAVSHRLNAAGTPPPSTGKRVYRDGKPRYWSYSQIMRMIRDPAYKGVSIAWRHEGAASAARRQERVRDASGRPAKPASEQIALPDGVTPPIVSPELWQAAQAAIASRAARYRQRNAARFCLLRGLIFCERCGRRMDAGREHNTPRNPAWGYRCASRHTVAGACGVKRVHAAEIETWVWERVHDLIRDPERALRDAVQASAPDMSGMGGAPDAPGAGVAQLQRDRDTAAREMARITARQDEMMRRFGASGDDSAFPWELVEREVSRLEREKRQWAATVTELDERLTTRATSQAEAVTARERLAALRPLVDSLAPEQRRDVLEAFGARVTAENGRWRLSVAYPVERGGEWVLGVDFTT